MPYLYYLIAIFVIFLDQLTKWSIVKNMEYGDSFPIIPRIFYITSHRNQGAAWGILQGQMWFFYAITVVVIIGIVYYIQKFGKQQRLFGISLAFLLGGAIGNFIDRVVRHEVVDFLDTYILGYDFPIFNIADASLTFGVILLIIHMLKDEFSKKEIKDGKH